MAKKKMKLSSTERARRRRQAIKNFGSQRGRKTRTTKTKRSNTMAKKKYSKSKSKSILGIATNDIWKGVGSGSAGLLGGVINQFAPQLAGNVAQGVGGLALSYFGTGIIKQMGKGAVIKTIGDMVEENVIPAISGSSFLGGNKLEIFEGGGF